MTAAPFVPSPDAERLVAQLMHEHRSSLMAHAVRLTNGDHAWAEDVVQETFIRAWRHRDRMTERRGSVRGWLMRVAHNVAVDGHRSRRAWPIDEAELGRALEPVTDASSEVLASMAVEEALSRLAQSHRAVLEEVYLQGRSVEETARRLDIPVGTVKSRAFYALRQLRASDGVGAYAD